MAKFAMKRKGVSKELTKKLRMKRPAASKQLTKKPAIKRPGALKELTEKESQVESASNDGAACGTRTFTISTIGGEQFEVSVTSDADVGDLVAEVAFTRGLGLCFSLIGADGNILEDASAPLPQESALKVHVENTSRLPVAAQEVLEKVFKRDKHLDEPDQFREKRLGRCRKLGRFPGCQWKEGGIESAISDIEDEDETYDMYGSYIVYEFTLLDGDDNCIRLVGVINEGNADANTGMWGSVYLRPGLTEVATIRSYGDTESVWKIKPGFDYKKPSLALPPCDFELLGGGRNANTPEKLHLAHALQAAYGHGSYTDAAIQD